ncbi:MAG: hypothetical protein LC754_10580 [Acidobacteria bacterium]|nr:hypothetical protein [Acidobacteriota bacterium]
MDMATLLAELENELHRTGEPVEIYSAFGMVAVSHYRWVKSGEKYGRHQELTMKETLAEALREHASNMRMTTPDRIAD